MSDFFDAAHYHAEELLRDGGSINIRAIRPDDRERLLRHFKELSEQSRYLRHLLRGSFTVEVPQDQRLSGLIGHRLRTLPVPGGSRCRRPAAGPPGGGPMIN